MNAHLLTEEQVFKELDTQSGGLSSAEAADRLQKHGLNKLDEGKKESLLHRLLMQFTDPMTIILLAAAAVSAVLAIYEHEFPTDVIIILAVVIINAVLGVLQESKAEAAIEALQKMSEATAKVFRDGKQQTLHSSELVPGDVIVLEAGDNVPADARVIESAQLQAEEASLTGESNAVTKTSDVIEGERIPLGDRKNMVYMGSTVVYGRGVAVVTGTGMHTEMGKIAGALSQAKDSLTPLQRKLKQLSKILTYVVLGICVVIFAFSLIRTGKITLDSVLDTFMIAVSLAVAAIPEGLATVVTIVLSIGVTNLSRQSAIIRKMTAVETLGCTQIICSDKTATLTQNRMTVVEHEASDEITLARALSLCSDSEIDPDSKTAVGEPTENALVNYAYTLGLDKTEEKLRYPRVGEVPFDSQRKMMTTVHALENGVYVQYTKGAPDIIISNCAYILENGEVREMTESRRSELLNANKRMADKALRVLAAAYKELDALPAEYTSEALEKQLVFAGLVGMIDPIRPEVKPAIDRCRSAGIRPVMITGDHKDTAAAIALQLGIIKSRDEAITGAELDEISDEQFANDVEKYSVYARVQPEHKTRIVKAWQNRNQVTAMTGDGVNDAPSIKNADIGVGMGITGTDVTKNAADMILADDNFATIVSAVSEGRRIYDNIRKAIEFLLTSNLAEVLVIFIATMFGFVIFEAPHLLWINLITDCFPALALGMEAPEFGIMNRKPRSAREGIFAGGMGLAIAIHGLFVTGLALASYFIGKSVSPLTGTTMAFVTLSLCEICHAFNMRSLKGSIFKMETRNIWLCFAALASVIATVFVVAVPFMVKAFDFASLSFLEFVIAVAIAFAIIPLAEVYKWVARRIEKK